MPIYEYQCQSCGERVEFIQRASEAPKSDCPQCGETESLRKLVSSPAIQFKGSGWYLTDYSDKGKKSRAAEKKETGDASVETGPAESSKAKKMPKKQDNAAPAGE